MLPEIPLMAKNISKADEASEGHLEEEMEALPLAKIWLHLIPHAPLTDPSSEDSLQAHSHRCL